MDCAAQKGDISARRVVLNVHREQLLFMVSDTGPGIAPEDQALIFEPFKQADAGMRHAGGTGLGLPISKRLIEVHEGKIWMESAPGEGTTFWFLLPAFEGVTKAQPV